MSISQELFDETVLENQDVFDLTPEQALQETLSQYSKLDLSHLLLSHPHVDTEERARLAEFIECLSQLDTCVQQDGSVVVKNHNDTLQHLQVVQQRCLDKDAARVYLGLLQQQEGFYTLASFLGVEDRSILLQTLQTLVTILHAKNVSHLRDLMGTIMKRWMTLYSQARDEKADTELQSALLELAYVSCRANEGNKTQWMKAAAAATEHNGLELLMDTLKTTQNADTTTLLVNAAKLVTVLCRFDDFRVRDPNAVGPIVSSAHDHVLEFARAGAVPILFALAQRTSSENEEELFVAALSALRVLAIQDDIVQSMVAVGVLKYIPQVLEKQQRQAVAAATLGLVRNLCANDEVKTTLCMGNSLDQASIVPGVLAAMQAFPKHALLQEHACGTLAAMALRKPRNSEYIVEQSGHVCIISAMRQHPQVVLVQRQGALALRNLASRSGNTREALLDSGAEAVLHEAGKHQASVDEAYAALRDLGVPIKLLKIKNGNAVERTAMFGESKPVFRPVFEESNALDEN